ncbi:NAD(P)-dependent alcohol dehydrogenase [Nocardia sp. NPDC088792]|uniref:NAD(P)-dependent alcohol dehydrogenase n=1 Tax=Nocardia sp. NPDC088792 TaxID=3364332 RepID=UPI0037F57E1B
MKISAAVLDSVRNPFVLKNIDLADPGRAEVLVELHSSGICQTDVAVQQGHVPFPLPGVLGHEGSGVIQAVGGDVTGFAVGDRVCLTFASCGGCGSCSAGLPSYCDTFVARNLMGRRLDGTSPLSLDGTSIGGNFFGQSCFASHAIADIRSVVKIPHEVPLALAAPLGCGVQTGAGAVLNSLRVEPGKSVLILGAGSVGLSAVMAAVLANAAEVIVVELVESRRRLAAELGATAVLDPANGPISEQVRELLPQGVNYAIDTTAQPVVLGEVVKAMAKRGAIGLLGVPADPASTLPLSLGMSQILGLKVVGIAEGDSNPAQFIPWLLGMYINGRFPLDRLVTTRPFSEFNDAIAAQIRGEVVKMVLTL